MTDDPKKKKKGKPTAYQAVIIENYKDNTFAVRMEAGRLEDGKYVPEVRKQAGGRCDALTAASIVADATARLQAALRDAATGDQPAEGVKQ